MRRGILAIGVALVALLGQAIVPAAAQTSTPATEPAPYRPGVVLVGFAPESSAAARADALRSVGAIASEQLSPLAADERIVRLGGMAVERAIVALSRNPNVRYAQPDYILTAADVSDDPGFTNGSLWGMYGDLTSPTNRFGSQAAEAWAGGNVGSRAIYVGVIDSGLYWQHADLAANTGNPNEISGNGQDDDGNGVVDDTYGYDFVYNDPQPNDGNGHGTHVAGTIGAVGGNGTGVAGVNWQVRILSGRFLNSSGSGYTSNAVRAVDYFTNLKKTTGLNIVATNNSWGGGGADTALRNAINRGGDEGILFVAAAGNGGTNNDASASYPSNYQCTTKATDGSARGWDCVVAVAAIDSSGAKASWSQYGATTVDLGAPGVSVLSTWNASGAYNTISGTSMATPHVTGAVALCASMGLADPSAIRSALMAAAQATPTKSLAGITVTGGRLNVGEMVAPCGGTPALTSLYRLSVSVAGAGSGSVSGSGISCTSGSPNGGTCQVDTAGTVALVATPSSAASLLSSWSGCDSTDGTYCYVTMSAAKSVTATFVPATYSLTVKKSQPLRTYPSVRVSTGGSLIQTVSTSSWTSSPYVYGTVFTLTAVTTSGASRVSWSGCTTVSGLQCTVTLTSAKTVTATFSK